MIVVSPLHAVQHLVDSHGVSHVVSLLGPDTAHRSFEGIESGNHLRLTFHDIEAESPGFMPPRHQDVQRLVGFLDGWDKRAPLLIHCWAGISRSTASAYTALCMLRGRADEEELAWELRAASPTASPNRLLIAHADAILGREGRMVRAISAIGRGEEAYEGRPFTLGIAG